MNKTLDLGTCFGIIDCQLLHISELSSVNCDYFGTYTGDDGVYYNVYSDNCSDTWYAVVTK